MGTEIERKFLVTSEAWRADAGQGTRLRQGYLHTGTPVVRIRQAGELAFLTIKGPGLLARAEYEYPIPPEDAEAMLASLCPPPIIDKTRHRLTQDGLTWEIDEFAGHLAGLVLAEIELVSADQAFTRPGWLGAEVTDDPRYQNAALSRADGLPA
ncbi:CYTH domain-containing protein [Belnapia sp. T18]|uniref:CYTH domain-containing protein n=1 Tax=Belnapia arida TaxID=2804533 RepID=A0ABS1TVV8_9PROT|nr:CYTH domain-containing protein [Belnapia arida]MBL6076581.1 CYTH domain-containing protein [Belnapia arida]